MKKKKHVYSNGQKQCDFIINWFITGWSLSLILLPFQWSCCLDTATSLELLMDNANCHNHRMV